MPSRQSRDRLASQGLFLVTLVPVLLVVAITATLAIRAYPILQTHSLWALLSGSTWKPLQSIFGFWPFIAGTLWVTLTSILLAVPPCLLTAIYLSEYARKSTRSIVKPLLDLLAAIPSVVYGVWGMIAIVPFVQNILMPFFGRYFRLVPFLHTENPTGFSILAGSIVLGIMIAPFIVAVVYEVMSTVPMGMRQASQAIGATRWQTVRYAVLPQVIPGILAGIVLGLSRALGETMAVLMVVGNVVQVPGSIFDAGYPLPALIANNYGEMMSIPLYDAALMLAALVLLLIVLVFNIASAIILQRAIGRVK